jgi:hypothetical protein
VSLSVSTRRGIPEELSYLHNNRMSMNHDTSRLSSDYNPRPASWNPRCDSSELFDLNLEKAILGTSLARDHRLASKRGVVQEEDQPFDSSFNTLKVSESNRNSMNGSYFRNYSWNSNGNEDRVDRRSSIKEQIALTEAQRHRNVMNRIVNERSLNPAQFDTTPKHARYFVIKSYNVHSTMPLANITGGRCP